MAVSLTTEALGHLEGVTRALLSPLAFATEDDWCRAVMEAFRPVFGSDAASFARPDRADGLFQGLDVDPETLRGLDHYLSPPNRQEVGPDPVVNLFFERIIPSQVAVWDFAAVERITEGRLRASEFYHDVLVRGGMSRHYALFDLRTAGGAHLVAHDAAESRRLSSEDATARLQLLLPAFRAGLDTIDRLRAHRAALDAAGEPLAAFDADGAETYRTPALRRLLAHDPEAEAVERRLATLAWRTRPLAFLRRADGPPGPPVACVEIQTATAGYALRPVLLPAGSGFGEAFLISVAARGVRAALPSADAIRQAFGLTRREAEVALLVAEGHGNDQVAERLFVSPHTVRHHVESAMAKLGLTGRGREAVAARLLDGGV